ncbi:MAG: pullulanase-type alpha-1,6-glucosidase [Balneolaceae bacterium]|nr:MAG: pullulanase-type alpha-1,6-glucosidase [Balneolaceae bacterium]
MKKLTILCALTICCVLTVVLQAYPQSVQEIQGASAHWVSSEYLIWDVSSDAEKVEIRYSLEADISIENEGLHGGMAIALDKANELPGHLASAFRHIADRSIFSVDIDQDKISQIIKGQLIAAEYDSDGVLLSATRIQFPGLIDDLYTYSGSLGPVYQESDISLKVWAPTARSMYIEIFDTEKNSIAQVKAGVENPANGVWSFTGGMDWDQKFYRLLVDVFHPMSGEFHQFSVTDPYSVSLSVDSHFSQFIDLNSDEFKPEGWDEFVKPQLRPVDISIYEAHVRDFSIWDTSVPEAYRGTYNAFTLNGENGNPLSDGMRHLRELSDAGLTHLHLLPINDIATVIEDTSARVDLHHPYSRICEFIDNARILELCEEFGDTPIRQVFEELTAKDPVTDIIQKPYSLPGRMEGLATLDGFNWGYDPFHFNAPEGSYSTNPDGPQRIREVRKMVQALFEIGLYTVIDVVYNHTFASGPDSRFSVLDKIVPGYYHRYNPDTGEIETSTCCDNTAAEHAMMEKLLIDSVLLWAKHYKIDSFRFDLMGHHPRYVMENLRDSLATLTLDEHGVDGANIYIYGEGWNFGEVAENRIFEQASQFNMGGTGIGNFNDRLRDGIRGGNYSWDGPQQGFTSGQYLFPNEHADADPNRRLDILLSQADRIRVGMAGNLANYPYTNRYGERVTGDNEYIGYALLPQETVNYIDKHDNETLWDNTQTKLPADMDMDTRVRIHNLSNAMINFSQGIPFFQMGSDILRSKSMDRNSFDSGDWYNAIDFTLGEHKWATGLPPAWDNENLWDDMVVFMSNSNIDVKKEHMELSNRLFREQLEIRYSTPLFRLGTAAEIHTRVAFHNVGPNQKPGIIAMSVSDGICAGEALDDDLDGMLIVYNADIQSRTIHLPGFNQLELHPVQQRGTDQAVTAATAENGDITIPALSYAVFFQYSDGEQGHFPCNF